jgi:hypothetical protein
VLWPPEREKIRVSSLYLYVFTVHKKKKLEMFFKK